MKRAVLGELCDFFNGGAWSDKEYVNAGIPVLKVTNCKSTGFQLDSLNYLSEKSREKYKKNELVIGDVIIATVGSHPNLIESAAGRSCIVNSQVEGFYLNQNAVCVRTKDKKVLSQKYLGYLCKCADFQHYIQSRGRGAANQMRIAISSIKEYSFTLPDIQNQHYIADILSAYDDLIENNQRQIKLLEEAAQRLYKEWFVDLRFPGHENTKFVDGVPEGWSVYPFSSKVDIMSGGTPKTSIPDYYNGKIPFYTPKDSDGAFFAYKTQINITEGGLKNCNSRLYPPKTVIITARGTVGKTTILAVPMAMNQSCYALKMKENDAPYYLFFALNNEIKALQTMANGGVFNTIIGKTFDSINIQIPKDPLIYGFEKTVRPFMEQIKNKLQANSKLVEARDRLLPKLMSGEVKV